MSVICRLCSGEWCKVVEWVEFELNWVEHRVGRVVQEERLVQRVGKERGGDVG